MFPVGAALHVAALLLLIHDLDYVAARRLVIADLVASSHGRPLCHADSRICSRAVFFPASSVIAVLAASGIKHLLRVCSRMNCAKTRSRRASPNTRRQPNNTGKAGGDLHLLLRTRVEAAGLLRGSRTVWSGWVWSKPQLPAS